MPAQVEHYIRQYGADVWRLCQCLCVQRPDAEDLYQETFARAFSRYETFDDTRDFRKWVFAICYNTYKNMRRSFSRQGQPVPFASEEEQARCLDQLTQPYTDRDVFLDVQTAVEALPQSLKAIVIFFYFDDLSVGDISQILEIPEQTVKNRLFQARKKLKVRLAAYEQAF